MRKEPVSQEQVEEILQMNFELSEQCDKFEKLLTEKNKEIEVLRKLLKKL